MTISESEVLLRELHVKYLSSLDKDASGKKTMSSFRAESIRMGGVYWALSSLLLLKIPIPSEKIESISKFIESCFDESEGGYGWSSGHDAHITSTHYAVLVLTQLDIPMDSNRREKILNFVASNQKTDGSFQCDKWGETDLRFALNAVSVLSLLDPSGWKTRINYSLLIEFVFSCRNFGDSGFGPNPDLESHAAYTFCAIGALVISGESIPESDRLAHWLCERQTPSGGFNGRPEKAPDVCYSWWTLSTLEMLGKAHWIDRNKLAQFILRAQEPTNGGIADRPECVPDVFHTIFGIAGLSLIDAQKFNLAPVDARYCIARPNV
jgi:geranylgeranyl transferase type-2 subunit beta